MVLVGSADDDAVDEIRIQEGTMSGEGSGFWKIGADGAKAFFGDIADCCDVHVRPCLKVAQVVVRAE